ncbi:hypothetical protein [Acetobacter persici]|uniref:hypothetical protein n=1 Tax=Acetobacter persici TaxID=1076596 RepID=UPI001BA6E61F|nr:hypothetical protein [Acetobacter persici]MBS1016903.1 hypothetical protein [Acetobacter persici]
MDDQPHRDRLRIDILDSPREHPLSAPKNLQRVCLCPITLSQDTRQIQCLLSGIQTVAPGNSG